MAVRLTLSALPDPPLLAARLHDVHVEAQTFIGDIDGIRQATKRLLFSVPTNALARSRGHERRRHNGNVEFMRGKQHDKGMQTGDKEPIMTEPIADASIYLWGREVATVSWSADDGFAVFRYTPEFAATGVELSPLVMPLSVDLYSFPALPRTACGVTLVSPISRLEIIPADDNRYYKYQFNVCDTQNASNLLH